MSHYLLEPNYVGVLQRPVVHDLPLNIFINLPNNSSSKTRQPTNAYHKKEKKRKKAARLLPSLDVLDGKQLFGSPVSNQPSDPKVAGADILHHFIPFHLRSAPIEHGRLQPFTGNDNQLVDDSQGSLIPVTA